MNPTLQLNLRQQIRLSPQLQQSMKLLQLSHADLQQEIQYQLDNNPLLTKDAEQDIQTSQEETLEDLHEQPQQSLNENGYTDDFSNLPKGEVDYENVLAASDNFKDKLEWQLQMSHLTPIDMEIGYFIIENLNDKGMLLISYEDIAAQVSEDINLPINKDEVQAIVHLVQQFDPIGCASSSLQEFLLLQLQHSEHHIQPVAQKIVTHHFEELLKHKYHAIQKSLDINLQQLESSLKLIQSLRNEPNADAGSDTIEYITPDIKVVKDNNEWQARLYQRELPYLSINQEYATILGQSSNPSDKQYLQEKIQKARWFIQGLNSRQDTLHKVAQYIVRYQQEFFDHGDEAIKPLRLQDIADKLDMHESTISRATSNKYLQAPLGVFELKHFFSNAIQNTEGGEWSSTAIKSKIKQLIKAEPSRKPLSDNNIVGILKKDGISIARRTVTKYRESLHIPASNQRKHRTFFNY